MAIRLFAVGMPVVLLNLILIKPMGSTGVWIAFLLGEMLNKISLCIEEMAGNVVQHAFKPGEKKWFDVLVLDKPESVVIRMRDNGAAFNPLHYLNTADEPDKEARFDIKMISSLADQFDYSRNMGLNVLVIVLDKQKI